MSIYEEMPIYTNIIAAGWNDEGILRAGIERLKPCDVDPLCEEMSAILHDWTDRSKFVESDGEEGADGAIVTAINMLWHIDHSIECQKDDVPETGGPLYALYRRTILSTRNIERLLFLCNAGCVPHDARRGSMQLLYRWIYGNRFAIGIKTRDGSPSLPLMLLGPVSKWLNDEMDYPVTKCDLHSDDDGLCHFASEILELSFSICKDDPKAMLHAIAPYQWTKVFDRGTYPMDVIEATVRYGLLTVSEKVQSDVKFFRRIWHLASLVLTTDPEDQHAKDILDRLGASAIFFRRLLRCIRYRNMHLRREQDPTRLKCDFENIYKLYQGVDLFLHCCVPPPTDPETRSLVRRVQDTAPNFAEAQRNMNSEASKYKRTLEALHNLLAITEDMAKLTKEGHSDSFQNYARLFHESDVAKELKDRKKARKDFLLFMLDSCIPGGDECCANCYALERAMGAGNKLMVCSVCNRAAYCCRECQVQHWKKAHKKMCEK